MWRRIPLVLFAAVLVLGAGVLPAAAQETQPAGDYEQVVDITFPTDPAVTYTDTYHDPRGTDRHHIATDLMGEKLMPVYAAVGGTITWIPGADGSPMPSYGYMISVAGDDGREYHYVHLNNDSPGTDDGAGGPEWAYAAGLAKGSRVERGQFIAYLGDSGNAEAASPHLHFEIEDPAVVDPYGTNHINPYNSLLAAEERGDYSTDSAPQTSGDRTGTTGNPAARSTDLACPSGQVPEDGFEDFADGASHEAAVDCIVWWGVAGGVSATSYAPSAAVTRAQMATFMARLLEAAGTALPAQPLDRFTDDAGSPHELRINQLAELGIVGGVAEDRFAPGDAVTRAQMATFLVRVVEHLTGTALTGGGDHFHDDDGSPHEANVDKVAGAGLATGTGSGHYSPAASVRRDQMGSFVARTLDLLVESGRASPPA